MRRRDVARLRAAALATLGVAVAMAALRLPLINDITTDVADPPAFLQGSIPPQPAEFKGPQTAAYPDVVTLRLPVGAGTAFDAVQRLAAATPRSGVWGGGGRGWGWR